jgi:hypothetical protein
VAVVSDFGAGCCCFDFDAARRWTVDVWWVKVKSELEFFFVWHVLCSPFGSVSTYVEIWLFFCFPAFPRFRGDKLVASFDNTDPPFSSVGGTLK